MNRIVLFAAVALSTASIAADYPNRPIRWISPFPPGGGSDLISRIVAQKLSTDFGQNVIVDNRPGAGSIIGTTLAAQSPPDGYTVVISGNSFAINAVYVRQLTYDTHRDFTPVSRLANQPNILVVHPRVDARSVKELIELARRKPGALNYASAGNGTGTQFAAELLKMKTNINMTHVPFKGTGPALNDLIAGQVDLYFSTLASAVPHIRNERLRALAVTSERRSPVFPDVPTMIEAGVADYVYDTWYGLQVPRATPERIVTILNKAIVQAVASTEVQEKMLKLGIEPISTSPQQFASFIRAELDRWGGVVRSAGLRAP